MDLGERCDEIVRLIDETLAALADDTGGRHPGVASSGPGSEAPLVVRAGAPGPRRPGRAAPSA